jgi:hypothetical protein
VLPRILPTGKINRVLWDYLGVGRLAYCITITPAGASKAYVACAFAEDLDKAHSNYVKMPEHVGPVEERLRLKKFTGTSVTTRKPLAVDDAEFFPALPSPLKEHAWRELLAGYPGDLPTNILGMIRLERI